MITEIRNKITTIGETVTSNFFYRNAGANKSQPRCVYDFFGNESGYIDTKSDFMDVYFQVSCYHCLLIMLAIILIFGFFCNGIRKMQSEAL